MLGAALKASELTMMTDWITTTLLPPVQVVADGGLGEAREYDWSDCGRAVEPAEWHDTVDDPSTIVLDCRNEFESEVRLGLFEPDSWKPKPRTSHPLPPAP